jgi:type IV pilus assembly protein PilC
MLEGTLARLADFLERTQKIRSKIVAALFYPASVICVAFGILSILTVFVIPKFKEVFADLTGSAALPPFTQLVMDGSQLFKSHFLLLSGLLVASVMALRLANATPTGRAAFDRIKLRLPVFGRITRKAAIGRFARTLGTMLENGVPVLQALTIARETTSNAVFAQAVQKTHDQVKEGETITAPLHASGIFPATVISMIDVGEQTGALPNMLLKVADNYDDEVDNTIASALSLLEPALIIFLAVVVGSIVIALFLPLLGIIDHGLDGGPGQGGE